MGGFGSGRRSSRDAKDATDNYLWMDVRRWHRDGALRLGNAFQTRWKTNEASILVRVASDQVVLIYQHRIASAEWTAHEYPVRLERTPCTYGGTRVWFICPKRDCCRRVAILYLGPAGIFACRHCLKLAYKTQRLKPHIRLIGRAEKIRVNRLGWPPGDFSVRGWAKPKGMHWRTFEWLKMEVNMLMLKGLTVAAQRIGIRPAPTEEGSNR